MIDNDPVPKPVIISDLYRSRSFTMNLLLLSYWGCGKLFIYNIHTCSQMYLLLFIKRCSHNKRNQGTVGKHFHHFRGIPKYNHRIAYQNTRTSVSNLRRLELNNCNWQITLINNFNQVHSPTVWPTSCIHDLFRSKGCFSSSMGFYRSSCSTFEIFMVLLNQAM